jgi:hypothetical protein
MTISTGFRKVLRTGLFYTPSNVYVVGQGLREPSRPRTQAPKRSLQMRGRGHGYATVVAALASLAFLGSASAASGETLSAWWHLRTSTRPSYIQPGTATDEVQRVTVDAGVNTYSLGRSGGGLLGRFTDEEVGSGQVELTRTASVAEIQAALESPEMYGPGVIEVTEVTTTQQKAEEVLSYDVRFVGRLTDLPVGLIGVSTEESAHVQVQQLAQGRPDGEIVLSAANVGDAIANPESRPITITDDVPRGLHVLAVEGSVDESGVLLRFAHNNAPLECSVVVVSCEFNGKPPPVVEKIVRQEIYPKFVSPFETIQVIVAVNVEAGGVSGENTALVAGGGASAVSVKRSLTVSNAPILSGLSAYEMNLEEQGGAPDTQAGSHPFQLTATEDVDETVAPSPVGLAKDLHFKLPPGLLGDPSAIPRCTLKQFDTPAAQERFEENECPSQTVVGVNVAFVRAFDGGGESFLVRVEAPVFNVEPELGEPARFGFIVEGTPVLLSTAVRSGGDYGVTVSASNIPESIEFLSNELTFWGVPGAKAHDLARGRACLKERETEASGRPSFGEVCHPLEEQHPSAFLSLPTSCTGRPLESSVEEDTWEEPNHVLAPFFTTVPMVTLDGCNRLPFQPSITATPDSEQASKPMGLNINVQVNQDAILNPEGLAESAVRGITVALPEEVAVNSAAGDGLEACSEGLVGFRGFEEPRLEPAVSVAAFTPRLPGSTAALAAGETAPLQPGVDFCANASKIGEVTIHTPVLPNPLRGFVYLAAQEENPFGSLVAMYIVAEDPVSGTLVKLPGLVHLTSSGQIVSTFENNPQAPFEDVEVHLFDGERAPLASPARCGAHATNASFTPWSGGDTVNASSTFNITGGSPCPGASLPFSPSLTAGTTNINAGAFTPFTMTLSRESGQQGLQAVELKLPEGLSGVLSGVELCPEPQADQGLCGPNSQIGETTASVGVGREPFTVTGGKVYITGPFNGTGACTVGEAGCAPFGLSIVSPAKAGPYDLENTKANHPPCDCVLVRGKIEFNPLTTALTVTTDNSGPYKIPTILEGIPLQIQHVNAAITRPGFQFNPTSCNKMEIAGNVFAAEGASAAISVPFQATNCQTLKFEPRFTVSTSGKTSKANGASLTTKVEEPAGSLGTQANIAMVKVELPEQLPSRLTTLQKACTDAQFELNPAGCPPESKIGYAVVHTPALPVPLQGPAIFVSHGGEAFPSLTMVLQGYGITVDLVGSTLIRKGITSTTFKAVPDQPFSTFELTLPEGKFSALAANGNLCTTSSLYLPYEAIGQNGAVVRLKPKIGVTGCAKKKPLTRAQKLTAALKACKKKSKNKRSTCEHAARKQYGTTARRKK